MSYLDRLNQIAAGTQADGGVKKHPVGDFVATIVDIKREQTRLGQSLYKLWLKTDEGQIDYVVWDITEQNVLEAETSSEKAELLARSIARTKQIYVDCGVASVAEVQGWAWYSEQGHSVITNLKFLVGAKCMASVQPRKNNPSERTVFINRVTDQPRYNTAPTRVPSEAFNQAAAQSNQANGMQQEMASQMQANQAATQSNQANGMQQQMATKMSPNNATMPGITPPNLDGIPF